MGRDRVVAFYSRMADYYDQLFPLNSLTLEFVINHLNPSPCRILDIGSATGQLAIQLARMPDHQIEKVTALEPDKKMNQILERHREQQKLTSKLSIQNGGMADLETLVKPLSSHMVLCLGNTLVHLQDFQQVGRFFKDVFRILMPGGTLIIQVVNYTRILRRQITQLPFLDRKQVSLERNYRYNSNQNRIYFNTRLADKERKQSFSHETTLLPLEASQIKSYALEAGFSILRLCGSYQGEEWTTDSPATIYLLQKK